MIQIHMTTTRRVYVAAFVAVLAASVQAPAQFTADGNLYDEILLALTDADGNGVPDILDAHDGPGIVFRYVDTTAEGTGFHPDGNLDGMSDEPSSTAFVPPGLFCQEDPRHYVRVPMNHGKVTGIYLMDSTGTLADGDDSVFYIGIDICNGDQYIVPGGDLEFGADGLPFLPPGAPIAPIVDYQLPGLLNCCDYGLPVTSPCDFINFMVPFDADGDGDPTTTTRLTADDGLPEDDDERYKVSLFACAGLLQEMELIRLELKANTFGSPDAVVLFLNDSPAPNPNLYPHHPPDGTDMSEIASWGDARFGQPGNQNLAILDVEFIIPGIDSIVQSRYSADPYETVNRFRLAEGMIEAFSDSDGDSANEDLSNYSWFIPIPQIEVTKKIRCLGEADDAWRTSAVALPGSVVEFKIEVENTGNVPLDVTLTDILEAFGTAGFTVDTSFLGAMLHDPCDGPGVPIDPFNAPDYGLDPMFFVPGGPLGFLTGAISGESRHLGTLPGIDVCADNPRVGACIKLIFGATVTAPAECNGQLDVDIRNAITATGVYDALPGVSDVSHVVDTFRETDQGFDDNVVTIDLKCRSLTFEKDVALCDEPNCPADPATCGPFVDTLTVLPGDPNSMVCLVYRYTTTNNGELDEQVSLTDSFFCTDLAAVGGTLVDCEVCTAPPVVFTVDKQGDPNDVVVKYCMFRLTRAQLGSLMVLDQDAPDCPTVPPPGVDDPDCYSNCAEIRATASPEDGVCLDGTEEFVLKDYATVCGAQCTLEVTKEVACIDECGPNGEIVPGMGYDDDPNWLVAPDACVRFRITIENTSQSELCDACKLRITDCLDPQPEQIIYRDNVVFELNGASCPVPGDFNVDCNSFDWFPSTCPAGNGDFGPGDELRIFFDAQIDPNADCGEPFEPNEVDAQNVVLVGGFTDCNSPEPDFIADQAEVTLDIACLDLSCTKEWRAEWDSDADCVCGPGLVPGPTANDYTSFLDLSDKVFPVCLHVRVTVTNDGEDDVVATPLDPTLCDCVNATAGASFVNPPCELCPPGVPKTVPKNGGTNTWECEILVETAEAMRQMALNTCDGGIDNDIFENTVTVTSTLDGVCGPGPSTDCSAEITPPPPCEMTVAKNVACLDACPTGNPIDPNGPSIEVAPGACVRFRMTVTNTGTVPIPLVCITDTMDCNWDWGYCAAQLDSLNVTACACDGFNPDGTRYCFDFATCRPAAPWIAPTETLKITFDVQVPGTFSKVGQDPDCTNHVTVQAYSENCWLTPPPQEACATGSASADVNVLVPDINCVKTITATFDDGFEKGPSTSLVITESEAESHGYPIQLRYTWTICNTGEVPLMNVELDDPLILPAPISVPPIPVGNCEEEFYDIVVADEAELRAFLCLDDAPTTCDLDLLNTSTVTGVGNYSGGAICAPPEPVEVSDECSAHLRYIPDTDCPETKVKFWIWNQNEVMFSGTERCVIVWNEQTLTHWTDGDPPDVPNNFLREYLQTDKGKARIDGVASSLCPDSIDAPLLGVAAKIMEVDNDPNEIALAASPLIGAGTGSGPVGRAGHRS